MKPSPIPSRRRAAFLLSAVLCLGTAGCGMFAELAYDSAAMRERAQCDRLLSMPDRQRCVQRVDTARRQADERRRAENRVPS